MWSLPPLPAGPLHPESVERCARNDYDGDDDNDVDDDDVDDNQEER